MIVFFNPGESKEIYYMAHEFINNGFDVYLSNFEEVDETNLFHKNVFNLSKQAFCDFSLEMLNKNIVVVFPRMLGSVEKQRDRICAWL